MFTFNSNTSFLEKLRGLFFKKPSKQKSFSGSKYPTGYIQRQSRKFNLEIPYQPIRPILNNVNNSVELLEMATWSYELRHAISNISRDCFQSVDGAISSWKVSECWNDVKVHKDVIAIARDLGNRQYNKEFVIGGNIFKKACADSLLYGDCFYELGIERDGMSKKYSITKGMYLPSLSVFVDIDEQNNLTSYSMRESLFKKATDLEINPVKVLHFSYEKQQIYGMPISLQSLKAWGQLKEASLDLANACRETGNSIITHTLPENATEFDLQAYSQRHEDLLAQGIITNLYLQPGVVVDRIANSSGTLEPLVKYWLQKRYECIPPGIPLWFFPGLGLESASGKDIANQPALNYARLIAYCRSIIGEQIKYAISLEIVLQKGYEWFLEHGNFDIIWQDWIITGQEQSD
jgi:hypothetical protein